MISAVAKVGMVYLLNKLGFPNANEIVFPLKIININLSFLSMDN